MSLDTLFIASTDSTVVLFKGLGADTGSNGLGWKDYLPIIFGLVGVGLGWFLGFVSDRRARRRDLLYAMHREFFSDLADVRHRSEDRLTFLLNKRIDEFDGVSVPRDNEPIWRMARFYQRLAVVVEHDEVPVEQVPDLFGGTFIWWYHVLFKNALEDTDWDMEYQFRSLHAAIRRQMGGSRAGDDAVEPPSGSKIGGRWDEWVSAAQRKRNRLLQEASLREGQDGNTDD